MWLLLLVVGAVAVAAVSRSPRACPPSPVVVVPPPLPGPISVLGEYLRSGQMPPPAVILCAIAEAETIGRDDLVADIVQAFIVPVVRQHALGLPGRGAPAFGSSAPTRSASRSPRAEAPRPVSMAVSMTTSWATQASLSASPAAVLTPVVPARRPALEQGGRTRLPTDEEIRAMLNADPRQFVELASRGTLVIETPVEAESPVLHEPSAVLEDPVVTEHPTVLSDAPLPAEEAAQPPGSPLPGVADDAWLMFVARLARESPQFCSSRHVGQYRQRRERLAELGIDPATLQGSASAQREALDADLLDAHRHCAASGVLAEHLARSLAVPGADQPERITLSGVLGVVQCAGLEGAVGWFERLGDRRRYPHTTQAFLRTNGVF